MTPLWLAALWGGGVGVALGFVVAWVVCDIAAKRAAYRARETHWQEMDELRRAMWREWRRERDGRVLAESRAAEWRAAYLTAVEEQDAGERWKQRRPAELDDRDRQGH